MIYTPTQTWAYANVTKIGGLIGGSKNYTGSNYFSVKDGGDFLKLLVYPVTHVYWNSVSRSAVNPVCELIGYNFTAAEKVELSNFKMGVSTIIPSSIIVLFGCGLTVAFLAAISYVKDAKAKMVLLFTYLVPIIYALSPISIFPERSVLYMGTFLSLGLVTTEIWKASWFWIFCGLMILRSFLWVIITVNNGGYCY